MTSQTPKDAPQATTAPKKWLCVSEAAARLGISSKSIWRKAKTGELTARKVAAPRGGFVWEIAADSLFDATGQPSGQTDRPTDRTKKQPTGQKPAFHVQTDRTQATDRPDNRPATAGEVELLRDALAREREISDYFRAEIETLHREHALQMAAMREALRALPRALPSPVGAGATPKAAEAPSVGASGGAAVDTPKRPNGPQKAMEAGKTGALTYGDVLAELENDLGARNDEN